jgi:hypothetical protein
MNHLTWRPTTNHFDTKSFWGDDCYVQPPTHFLVASRLPSKLLFFFSPFPFGSNALQSTRSRFPLRMLDFLFMVFLVSGTSKTT